MFEARVRQLARAYGAFLSREKAEIGAGLTLVQNAAIKRLEVVVVTEGLNLTQFALLNSNSNIVTAPDECTHVGTNVCIVSRGNGVYCYFKLKS